MSVLCRTADPVRVNDEPGTEGDVRTLELADIIDVAEVQMLMNDFHHFAQIPMGIVDVNGRVLVSVGWQRICTQFHRVNPETCRHCVESDTQLSTGVPPGEFRLYKCRNNMWDVATPIMVGNRHVGNVFSGQFFFSDETVDRELFRSQARLYGFDEAAYLAALDAVPRLSREAVDTSVGFFLRLAQMLSQLSHSNIELARSMCERERLMHSLRRSQQELQDTADRLAEANRLKDQFLTTLSHELRTPLTAIVGWSQMLLAGTVNGEAARRALEVIFSNAQAQAHLIDDVLDVSRIVTGKMRLDVRPTAIGASVQSAVDSVRLCAEAKGIDVTTSFESGAVAVGDPNRLQQVFANLLSNAVKFTPAGGQVEVSVACVDSSIEVQVTDSGHGIDPGFLPHVFERFRQQDGSTTRGQTGLGLGLAIVKRLVELHGGEVKAASDGPGRGSTFTVTLPVCQTSRQLGTGHPETTETARAEIESPSQLGDLRILVVDDEADTREMLCTVLKLAGAEVQVAASGDEALAQLTRALPDVLVSDIGMPMLDGYELMRNIRDRGVNMRAIALSGYGREEDREQALKAGFERHITKPVLPAELVAVVADLARQA